MKDLIERQDAIDALYELYEYMRVIDPSEAADLVRQGVFLAEKKIENLPSAQPESKYTVKELDVFRHCVSLRLLSLRSAQHWRYDEETEKEIDFLEQLYEKVREDINHERPD